MKEKFRTSIFIGIWVGMWIGFFIGNREFVLFVMANLILWAIIEQSFILIKVIKELIKIMSHNQPKQTQ